MDHKIDPEAMAAAAEAARIEQEACDAACAAWRAAHPTIPLGKFGHIYVE